MDKTSRALRRHHRARLINRYADYDIIRWRYEDDYDRIQKCRDQAKLLVDHIAICSCSMCRNERRNPWVNNRERLTMQERKAEDSYKDEIRELNEGDIHEEV